jgi:hypothetical protein
LIVDLERVVTLLANGAIARSKPGGWRALRNPASRTVKGLTEPKKLRESGA